MRHTGRTFFLLFLMVIACGIGTARPASAQTDVGIGYQFFRFTSFEGINYPVGINGDVAVPLGDGPIGIVGEVGWSRASERDNDDDYTANLFNLSGGVRYTIPLDGDVSPYAQALLGYLRDSEEFGDGDTREFNEFALGIDGGVQFAVSEALDAFGQAGYRYVGYEGDAGNGFRFVVGVRFGL